MTHLLKIATLGLLLVASGSGCQKKVENTAPTPPSAAAETSPANTATSISAAPTDSTPMPADIKQSLAASKVALKAGAYQQAAQNLLAVQQLQKKQQLTAQQAQQAYNQMAQLQGSLASAVANGDPNAKAAAALLRNAAMNR